MVYPRPGHLIGSLLQILEQNDEFYPMVSPQLLGYEGDWTLILTSTWRSSSMYWFCQVESKLSELVTSTRVKAAACRVLLAALPSNNGLIVELLGDDEDTLERLCAYATDLDPSLRCYATGVLAVALRDRSIADIVVNMDTPVKFLKRARMYASKLEKERQAALKYMQENLRAGSSRHKKGSAPGGGASKAIVSQRSLKRKHSESNVTRASQNSDFPDLSAGVDTEADDDMAPNSVSFDGHVPVIEEENGIGHVDPETGDVPDQDHHDEELKRLVVLELLHTLDCIGSLGEYQELFAPALKEDIMATIITFLHSKNATILSHTMKLTSHFLAHRKFAFLLIETGGVALLFSATKAQQAVGQFGLLERSLSMCLYGLASLSDVIERILTADSDAFLSVAFGLLSSPNDRARQNAVVFFSLTLCFKVILEYFEKNNGLYTLLNIIRVGNHPKSAAQRQLTHDACLCLRQYLRVHMALVTHRLRRRIAQVNCRSAPTPLLTTAAAAFRLPARLPKLSISKPVDIDDKAHESNVAFYEKYRFSVKTNGNSSSSWSASTGPGGGMWPPAAKLCHLRGILVILEVIEMMCSVLRDSDPGDSSAPIRVWTADRAQLCLESLRILTLVVPNLAQEVCSTEVPVDESGTIKCLGITVLLEIAMSTSSRDSDLVREALQVLCNCVCPPHAEHCWQHPYKDIRQFTLTARSMRKRKVNRQVASSDAATHGPLEDASGEIVVNCCSKAKDDKALRPVRKLAREKNAIKICIQLLKYRRSVQNADAIRLLATRTLLGLARDRHISQILEQMQVGQLLSDMIRSEPVLEENADIHVRFRECALDLISQVTHRASDVVINEATDPTVRKIEKASIVANTKVVFAEDELIKLIHEHLVAKGLTETASTLLNEAKLETNGQSNPHGSNSVRSPQYESVAAGALHVSKHAAPLKHGGTDVSTNMARRARSESVGDELQRPRKMARLLSLRSIAGDDNLELAKNQLESTHLTSPDKMANGTVPPAAVNFAYTQKQKRIQRALTSPHLWSKEVPISNLHSSNGDASHATAGANDLGIDDHGTTFSKLDEIITDYLREQHRQCTNPVTTVPPFRLLGEGTAHHCPDKPKTDTSSVNICTRLLNRDRSGYRTGMRAFSNYYADAGIDRYVFSRYRPYRVVGAHSGSTVWNGVSVARFFGKNEEDILIGNHDGELRLVNIESDDVVNEWSCHSSSSVIVSLETNERSPLGRQNPLVVTGTSAATAFGASEIALWDVNQMESARWRLNGAFSPQFNHYGDRLVALDARELDNDEVSTGRPIRGAMMIDTATGSVMCELNDAMRSNNYGLETNCRFSRSDGTILTDGMLWDARIPTRALYKFDKLSNIGYGYFHPNGNEIIINSAVWDLRTYRLMRVVPALDRCNIKFNHTGNVLYAYYPYPAVSGYLLFWGRRLIYGLF